MARMTQKILENRRRQHAHVTAHKRRIRDEVKPKLAMAKRAWSDASKENNLKIKCKWHAQKMRVQALQRDQKIRHKAKIQAHKRRLRAELARRG
jgi:hypothetical protein